MESKAMTTLTRLVLVDDHSIVRHSLSAYLNAQPDLNVVGAAASGEVLLAQLDLWQPDVIIMDIAMPGGINGIETTQQVIRRLPTVKVIMLSGFDDEARIIGALRAGALTYLAKDAEPETLLATIRQAAQGKATLDPALQQLLLAAQGTRYRDLLTNRELDVLQGIADGLTNHEIAQRLTITDETVKTHISSMLRKLNLSHRTQLALFALRNGWVQ